MKPFFFRLERLFDLRRKEERARARALGQARRAEQAQRETLDEANGHLDRCSRQIADTSTEATSAGMLQNFDLAVKAAAGRAAAAADSHQAAAEAVRVERERFESAQQKRRVVERLRERKREAHSQEASRQEQRELDGQARRHRAWRQRQ
jgi:flagellar export protein FliJ